MRKTLTSAAIALALGAGAAQAAPITLPPGSPIFFQFGNLEQVNGLNLISVPGGSIDVNNDGILDTPGPTNVNNSGGEGNWGVFNITSMQQGAVTTPNSDINTGPVFFFDDGDVGDNLFKQGQVTGIFYGITLTSGKTATGGWIDIYWEDFTSDDIDAVDIAGGPGTLPVRTAANKAGDYTDGTLLVRLAFKPGIITGDNFNTLRSDIDPTAVSPGGRGEAQFFADVVDINNDGKLDSADGAWAYSLDSNWFFVDTDGDTVFGEANERRDLRFSTIFNNTLVSNSPWHDPANGTLGLRSSDPGRAFTVAEPGMVSLLGLGLLGAGLNLRRRKRA